MSLTLNDNSIFVGLDELINRRVPAGAERGLNDAAPRLEAEMQNSPAHGDQSGASHASYSAIPIGGNRTGEAEAANGYAAAASLLTGFTGHNGKPLRQDSGVRLNEDERGLILTAFTDYQVYLETENAGENAVIGPTLLGNALEITRAVADGIKEGLR